MKLKLIAISAGVLITATSVAGWVFLFKEDKQPPETLAIIERTAHDPMTGLSLRYKEPLDQDGLTEQDKQDKFILRLTSTEPAMLISARYEDGLKPISTLARQDLLENLLSNSARALPLRFPNYHKVSERRLEVTDRQASELIFSYTGPNGDSAKQRLLIILKDDNTAIYLSAQAQESNFEEVNSLYFDPIFSSISFK